MPPILCTFYTRPCLKSDRLSYCLNFVDKSIIQKTENTVMKGSLKHVLWAFVKKGRVLVRPFPITFPKPNVINRSA